MTSKTSTTTSSLAHLISHELNNNSHINSCTAYFERTNHQKQLQHMPTPFHTTLALTATSCRAYCISHSTNIKQRNTLQPVHFSGAQHQQQLHLPRTAFLTCPTLKITSFPVRFSPHKRNTNDKPSSCPPDNSQRPHLPQFHPHRLYTTQMHLQKKPHTPLPLCHAQHRRQAQPASSLYRGENIDNNIITTLPHPSRALYQQPHHPPLNQFFRSLTRTTTSLPAHFTPCMPNTTKYSTLRPAYTTQAQHSQPHHFSSISSIKSTRTKNTSSSARTVLHKPNNNNHIISCLPHSLRVQHQQPICPHPPRPSQAQHWQKLHTLLPRLFQIKIRLEPRLLLTPSLTRSNPTITPPPASHPLPCQHKMLHHSPSHPSFHEANTENHIIPSPARQSRIQHQQQLHPSPNLFHKRSTLTATSRRDHIIAHERSTEHWTISLPPHTSRVQHQKHHHPSTTLLIYRTKPATP